MGQYWCIRVHGGISESGWTIRHLRAFEGEKGTMRCCDGGEPVKAETSEAGPVSFLEFCSMTVLGGNLWALHLEDTQISAH